MDVRWVRESKDLNFWRTTPEGVKAIHNVSQASHCSIEFISLALNLFDTPLSTSEQCYVLPISARASLFAACR
jgi:hypothetical protein